MLTIILEKFPLGVNGRGWCGRSLSRNPYLDLQFVVDNPKGVLSINRKTGEQEISPWDWLTIFSLRDDWEPLLKNYKIIPRRCWNDISTLLFGSRYQHLHKYPDLPWNWHTISSDFDLDLSYVLKYPYLPWNYNIILSMCNVTIDFINNLPKDIQLDKNEVDGIIAGREYIPEFTYDFEYKCTQDDADWEELSHMIDDWNYIIRFIDKPWNYDVISSSRYVNWDIIKSTPELPWNYYKISNCDNIDWDFVKANPYKNWNWRKLSMDETLKWNFVCDNPHLPWVLTKIKTRPLHEILCNNGVGYTAEELSSLYYIDNTPMMKPARCTASKD